MTARPKQPFAAGLALALFFAALVALPADTVSNLTIDNEGGFVLAAEIGDRDKVRTSFIHQATGVGGETYEFRYVVVLRQDTDESIVGEGNVTKTVVMSPSGDATVEPEIGLEISSPPLNPYSTHSAKISRIDRRLPGESWEPVSFVGDNESNPRRLLHFTNVDPQDERLNVISTLNEVAIQENTLVDTVEDYDHFVARVDAEFHRWDKFNQSIQEDDVTAQFHVSLIDENGEKVPLENDGIVEKTFSLPNYKFSGGTQSPSQATFSNLLIPFRPAGQLNSVSSEYRVDVTINHLEVTGEPASLQRGNSLDTPQARFLHSNGTVLFGDIDTTLIELTARPSIEGPPSPPPGDTLPISVSIAPQGGFIDGSEDLVFGGGSIDLLLDSNGLGVYEDSSEATAARPSEDYTPRQLGSFRFRHRQVGLSGDGANGSIELILPAGTGILGHDDQFDRPDQVASFGQALAVNRFDQEVFPVADTLSFSYGSTLTYLSGEQFPLLYELSQLTWNLQEDRIDVVTNGVHSAQGHRYVYLSNPPGGVIPNERAITKRSNQYYLRGINPDNSSNSPHVTIRASRQTGAALVSLSTPIDLESGQHKAHFPLGLELSWDSGDFHIQGNQVHTGNSSLSVNDPVEQTYASGCPTAQCPTDALSITSRLQVDGGQINFTAEGGLFASGNIVDAGGDFSFEELQWGRNDSGGFTHEATPFFEATFYSAGFVLHSDNLPEQSTNAPAQLLLSGLDKDEPADTGAMERPGSTAYRDGLGDYPGFNFRVPGDGDGEGRSILGGVLFEFGLTGRSKFYTRYSGVAGIHEAVEFNQSKEIYGYPFQFWPFLSRG